MTYTTATDQNARQLQDLLLTFVSVHFSEGHFDAIDVGRLLLAKWGLRVDWHDVSDALERMHAKGQIQHAGFTGDRMTRYSLAV